MQFDNHPPVNFDNSEKLAKASRDGGCYDNVGWDTYTVFQGGKIHLVHSYNSGCDYGSGTTTNRAHLGIFGTREELVAFLVSKTDGGSDDVPQWAANELLEQLGYSGVEA